RDAEAERELQLALEKNPSYVPALFNYANLHEDLGRREQAARLYERILELEPRNYEALARYANLQQADADAGAWIERLQAALADPRATAAERASVGFALGRLLDAAARYDEAFAVYTAANRASRASAGLQFVPYDARAEERYLERIVKVFARPADAPPIPGGERPIFICGMFRSGSTLLERMLAGHPEVQAGGELALLARLVAEELQPFPERCAALQESERQRLAERYLNDLARLYPAGRFVTDKRPDNFWLIGLIKLLWPQAKIIHTVRDPRDVCLSIYFLHLDHRMNYAFELEQIGRHYSHYRRLMAHWRSLYGGDILDFDYDTCVREPRAEVARLLDFLGLPWDERCLAVERRAGAVKTASVWQVREPLYRRSSGRWRHYARHIDSLNAALGECGPQRS
ncbi:MAG: sulfotransferase, partial [Steroidobacteraceae bacterium]|nr:sulfotransferase [Steroidobacteraceae bacterium]